MAVATRTLERGDLTGTPPTVRALAATSATVAAIAHVPPLGVHLQEVPYVGVLFALLTTVCLAAAVGLVLDERPGWWALSGASCVAAVVLYVVSRTVGLPGMADDIGNWGEPLGVVSVVSESATAFLAAAALAGTWWRLRNS